METLILAGNLLSAIEQEEIKKKLFYAIENNECRIINEILQEYPEALETTNSYGDTPLHYAVRLCKFDVVEYLIKNNANVYAKNRNGQSILHYSLPEISEKENINYRVLMNHFILKLKPEILNIQDSLGLTPIHKAFIMDDKENIDLFLKYRANTSIPDNFQCTIMHRLFKHPIQYGLFLTYSAYIFNDKPDKKGNTPFHLLTKHQIFDNVKFYKNKIDLAHYRQNILNFISYGANPLAKNKAGKTPLDYIKEKVNNAKIFKSIMQQIQLEQDLIKFNSILTPNTPNNKKPKTEPNLI